MILPTINRHLFPLKAAYFFYAFSYFSIIHFTPTFLRQIGLDAEQTGIINGSRMFIECLTGPLWGIVADKKRKHRALLLTQIIGASTLTFMTPWIPKILSTDIDTCTATELQNMTGYNSRQAVGIKNSIGISTGISKGISSGISKGIVNKTLNADTLNLMLENSNTANQSNNTNNSCHGVMNVYLFPIILIVLNIAAIFDGGIILLLDTLLIGMIKRRTGSDKIDFGKQRMWAGIGFVLASVATGVGVQLSGSGKANYLTMFCIYLVGNICLFIVCLKFIPSAEESVEEKDKMGVGKGLVFILKHFDATFFFSTIFVEGFANGLILGFLFWYIKDLRGTEILMGVSNVVAGTSNIIAFLIAEKFIKFIGGNLNALNLGLVSLSVRFFAMSYVTNAWHILFLQLLQGIGFAVLWVAAISHTSLLAPPGLLTTFLGILNSIHYGMSAGASIILGGIWYKRFGGTSMFRGASIVCVIWSLIVLLYILSRKRRERRTCKPDNDIATVDGVDGGSRAVEPDPLFLVNMQAMKDHAIHKDIDMAEV